MARNNKEKSPFDIFMEDMKQKYADSFGKPKANKHQGDDLSWEEFLAHELFNATQLLEWYEERDDENLGCGCGENRYDGNCGCK
jgi:hypothetical protein